MSMPALRPPPGMAMQYPGQPGVGIPPQASQPPASVPGKSSSNLLLLKFQVIPCHCHWMDFLHDCLHPHNRNRNNPTVAVKTLQEVATFSLTD